MPIFLVRVTKQTTKEFAVNCVDQDDARRAIMQNLIGNSSAANPNVVVLNDNTAENTEVSQVEASAKWEDYVSKGVK